MQVSIEISCEDKKELIQHLKQIIKEVKEYDSADIEEGTSFEDDNCYGSHTVNIDPS